MPVTFDTETIQLINLFENLNKVHVKDCLIDGDNTVYFVVQGDVSRAIGKNGTGIRNTERLIRRYVKVVSFSDDLERFVKNLIPQAHSVNIKTEGDKIFIEVGTDKNSKAIVIGRDGKNLKVYKELLQRSYHVSDVTVR